MEKYKKKLQEGADLRQSVKVTQHAAFYTIPVLNELASLGFGKTKCGPCGQECVSRRRVP